MPCFAGVAVHVRSPDVMRGVSPIPMVVALPLMINPLSPLPFSCARGIPAGCEVVLVPCRSDRPVAGFEHLTPRRIGHYSSPIDVEEGGRRGSLHMRKMSFSAASILGKAVA